jgi:hypothetical protein
MNWKHCGGVGHGRHNEEGTLITPGTQNYLPTFEQLLKYQSSFWQKQTIGIQ